MDAYDRCNNLEKESWRYCCHLWSWPRTFQTNHAQNVLGRIQTGCSKIESGQFRFASLTIFTS